VFVAWRREIWLGVTKVGSDWVWNNGDALDTQKFSGSQPDGTGSCINMFTNFRWNDNYCDFDEKRYVCEK